MGRYHQRAGGAQIGLEHIRTDSDIIGGMQNGRF